MITNFIILNYIVEKLKDYRKTFIFKYTEHNKENINCLITSKYYLNMPRTIELH
jgi:hypothetical protein